MSLHISRTARVATAARNLFTAGRPARYGDPGFVRWKDGNGTTWLVCTCFAEWIGPVEALAVKRGYIVRCFDFAQTVGTYIKSGQTHWGGGVADLWQTSREIALLIRECGGVGNIRTRKQGFSRHNHLCLNGCPHEHATAAGQVADVIRNGMNGLTGKARGRDTDPRPKVWRSWRAGKEWAKAQLDGTPAEPTKPLPAYLDPASYYVGAHGSHVLWLGDRLIEHGFGKGYTPTNTFTSADVRKVALFQKAQGWSGSDADGMPGRETLRRLEEDA